MAKFKEKLERLCAYADGRSSAELKKGLSRLTRSVADVLKKGQWDEPPIRLQNEIEGAAEAMRENTELFDAAEFVNDRVLKAKNGAVYDIKISSEFNKAQEQIDDFFNDGAPGRGFVYVAWSGNPEQFLYVGRAASKARLNLKTHPKLAHAIAHASTLSIVYPNISKEENIKGLEASIICIINSGGFEGLELNDRGERVPHGGASQAVQSLAQFLVGIADKIER